MSINIFNKEKIMTERSYGQKEWHGVVVNVNDPDQEGRVQIRIFGLHDDIQNIVDSNLPWAKPYQDVTSAGHNKIGGSPVGLIKGAYVGGHFLDSDKQYPVFHHSIAKAGDPQKGSTTNGQVDLVKGTNSTPIAERNKNAFVTRKGRNIKEEDNANTNPTESKDSDGVDITAKAISNTKFATIPTVGSLLNAGGSILTQLTNVDPKHLTSVLPNAVANLIKIQDLHTFSSTAGITNVLGQAMGQVMSSLGVNNILSALTSLPNIGFGLSDLAKNTLLIGLQNTTANNTLSPTVGAIVQETVIELQIGISELINGSLSLTDFEALLAKLFGNIQNSGSSMLLGVNSQNILASLASALPQIAGAIQSTLTDHLPTSVLNQSTVTTALQKFSMNQAYIKKPTDGKKDLAKSAVQTDFSDLISSATTALQGLSNTAQSFISSII
jgi:hypothetical protein